MTSQLPLGLDFLQSSFHEMNWSLHNHDVTLSYLPAILQLGSTDTLIVLDLLIEL